MVDITFRHKEFHVVGDSAGHSAKCGHRPRRRMATVALAPPPHEGKGLFRGEIRDEISIENKLPHPKFTHIINILLYHIKQSSQLCGPQLCVLSKKVVYLQSELIRLTYHEEVFCVRRSR